MGTTPQHTATGAAPGYSAARYAPAFQGSHQEPDTLYSEIAPGLYQGGTRDEDWLDLDLDPELPGELAEESAPESAPGSRFDAVVTLFALADPCGWGVEELRFGFADARLRDGDSPKILEAARWAHRRWAAGQRVLIRCQAGLNRSGLITALVLMLAGRSAEEAIATIRSARAPVALFNRHFVDWLIDEAPQLLHGGVPPIAATGGECTGWADGGRDLPPF